MDVNYYCLAGSEYVIAEFTILRFNLADGIKDDYHEIINPGKIWYKIQPCVTQGVSNYVIFLNLFYLLVVLNWQAAGSDCKRKADNDDDCASSSVTEHQCKL